MWPDQIPTSITDQATANTFTDAQIKASIVGNYIHDSLTEDAIEQLSEESELYKVKDLDGNKYFDGASYFHVITSMVDLDNGHLVSNTKKHLR